MVRAFVSEVSDRVEVQEVVRGGQLLPARALGVHAPGRAGLDAASEIPRRRETRRERRPAVQRAPLEPEPRLHREAFREPEGVLHPGASA